MNDDTRRRFVTEVVAARARADSLLRQLIDARQTCEAHLAEQNRPDPIRLVTGQSSLDRAISDTQRMISTIDRALNDADRAEPGLLKSIADAVATLSTVARPGLA